MARNYSSPRYKNKSRPGRKSLPEEACRKLIAARVAPDTYNYLQEQDMKIGLFIDQLIRREMLGLLKNESHSNLLQENPEKVSFRKLKDEERETLDFDAPECLSEDAYDVITEQARGLVALVVERGTTHLTQEQIEILSNNFALLINNFLATFRKRP